MRVVIFAAAFAMSQACWACSCLTESAVPLGAPGESLESRLARMYYNRANMVVRVRVQSRSATPNGTEYQAEVLESYKAQNAQAHLTFATDKSSCSMYLEPSEEWLLFSDTVNPPIQLTQCSGSMILSGGSRISLLPHEEGSKWLSLIRAIASPGVK